MTAKNWIDEYEAALATQNWEMVAPLIHLDATVTFSNGTTHRGISAVEQAFCRNFSLIKSELYRISEVHWVIATESFVVFTFVYDWSGEMDGQQIAGSGRGTSSLVQENGHWLMVSEHLGPKSDD